MAASGEYSVGAQAFAQLGELLLHLRGGDGLGGGGGEGLGDAIELVLRRVLAARSGPPLGGVDQAEAFEQETGLLGLLGGEVVVLGPNPVELVGFGVVEDGPVADEVEAVVEETGADGGVLAHQAGDPGGEFPGGWIEAIENLLGQNFIGALVLPGFAVVVENEGQEVGEGEAVELAELVDEGLAGDGDLVGDQAAQGQLGLGGRYAGEEQPNEFVFRRCVIFLEIGGVLLFKEGFDVVELAGTRFPGAVEQ